MRSSISGWRLQQQALAEMATESQAGFAKWIEDATSLASGKAA